MSIRAAGQLIEKSYLELKAAHSKPHPASTNYKSDYMLAKAAYFWRSSVGSRISGKERDAETGLDYFGARYLSSAQGRFTSADPNMQSTRRSNPQIWNRYSYVLNNPYRFIDPNGELWVSSGNFSNPYMWQDECKKNQTCYDQIAFQQGESVWVYGPNDANDKQQIPTNDNGYIDLDEVAGASGAYFSFDRHTTGYFASPQTAVDIFNAASDYHSLHKSDSKWVLTDAGNEIGTNFGPHKEHMWGRGFDMRYIDNDGNPIFKPIGSQILSADDNRMLDVIQSLRDNGFPNSHIYSDNDKAYGVTWRGGHGSHLHAAKDASTARCEIGPCK